uniref:dihydrolipoyllysine-residue succinyltransferase component of 2-oxoglutarate dehydrogenase complex, mitochondrial-like isoform X1 n=1 Tax=Styela clava TaxID=7725 RepID=UPI00193A5700|nr:dihydrolipoyllysine-residue succinyltransferase component of 2-oxoglutarate dehydrogenase complex, mitochondrial-like isoform X1 [Styela clava]
MAANLVRLSRCSNHLKCVGSGRLLRIEGASRVSTETTNLHMSTKHLARDNQQQSQLLQKWSRTDKTYFWRFIQTSSTSLEAVTVNCPAFAESISEGDIRWEKAEGEAVEEDETVAEIETDKTSIPIAAPSKGVVEKLLVEDGSTVTPGTPLFTINSDGAAAATPKSEPADVPAPPTPTPDTPASSPPKEIPSTLPPAPPVPTQPLSTIPVASVPVTPVKTSTPSVSTEQVTGARTENRVKMNRMRQRIAQRLKDSQNTAAMLTTFNEIDMTNIKALRNKYKDDFLKKHGIKLSFMSAFIKASAYALQDQPVVNAVIDDATKEMIYRDYVDISIAVATPRGLVVPVLRNCEAMNYKQIEKEMNELAAKARNNELAVEDMDGGTFTISNGGVFGSMFGTPIINPPQSAILGMHAIFDRPVAIDGKVEIRPMMYVALTYDHRLVDGREAVTFLRKIKQAVEDPQILLLDL